MAGHWKIITEEEVFPALALHTEVEAKPPDVGYGRVIEVERTLRWASSRCYVPIHWEGYCYRAWVEDERPEHERLLDGVELSATASGKCELCAVREDLDGALRYWNGYRWVYILATRRYAWAHRDPADLTHVEWAPDHDYLWPCTETTRPCAVALWLPKEERT